MQRLASQKLTRTIQRPQRPRPAALIFLLTQLAPLCGLSPPDRLDILHGLDSKARFRVDAKLAQRAAGRKAANGVGELVVALR